MDTEEKIMEHSVCSRMEYMSEELSLKTTKNLRDKNSPGLTIYLPREKVRRRATKSGSLLYDIYASQSYTIRPSRYTFYLRIEEISVLGQGCILFSHKLKTRLRRIKRKTIVRDTKLYLPTPYDFEGTIKADQYLGT